jgi:4-hydroxy-tetrahydrodipicolinate synthase
LHGLWLPLVTPFRSGELDETSLRRLVRHYAALPVNGLILAATTGESLTLTPEETERLVFTVRDEISGARNLPICLGLSGSNTRALLDTLDRTAAWPIDGYLISCPYYSRPSQQGLQRHFSALADRARHPVMIYNIPYRTGVNLGNEAMLRLADHRYRPQDCCDDRSNRRTPAPAPAGFAVLTGEDAQYMRRWSMARRHSGFRIETRRSLGRAGGSGERDAALKVGGRLQISPGAVLEPSPAPIKYWLWRGVDRQRGSTAAGDEVALTCRAPRSGNPTPNTGPTAGTAVIAA